MIAAQSIPMSRYHLFADSEGFEPPEVLPSLAFETSALGRSANYPLLTFANICQQVYLSVFLCCLVKKEEGKCFSVRLWM